MKCIVLRNFSVRVIDAKGIEHRVDYRRGMVVDEADIPAGQTSKNWRDKKLVKIVAGRHAT